MAILNEYVKKTQTKQWVFTYTTHEGKVIVLSEEEAKKPEKTRTWKQLQTMLHKNEVYQIEYTLND